ncbi:hypothetical protein [Amycolatopsis sp. CA-128772]|uniref:hypothetical protein n=1 Tax=Amycolatopsis sp. CA-128772 TaxID=2073159 RepID=UPI00351AAD9A
MITEPVGLDLRDLVLAAGERGRERVALAAQGVQLAAELREQRRVVRGVGGAVVVADVPGGEPGYSQSMSMPSKMPAAAASEKYLEYVQPPIDSSI